MGVSVSLTHFCVTELHIEPGRSWIQSRRVGRICERPLSRLTTAFTPMRIFLYAHFPKCMYCFVKQSFVHAKRQRSRFLYMFIIEYRACTSKFSADLRMQLNFSTSTFLLDCT